MKEGWEYKKIKDVAEVFAGQGAPQGDSNYCSNGIPFIKAGNLFELINGKNEASIQNVSEQVALSHKLRLYKAGSVLFAKSGMSCMKGYVYTLKNDCYVVSHLAIITPHSVNSHFLNYYLCVNKPNSLIKDAAYPSISLKDIENLKIPIPPLAEQKRIVEELDLLSSIIDKKKAQLKELDQLAQSIFYTMFGDPITNPKGWQVQALSTVCDVRDGTHDSPKYVDNGYPLITSKNVVNGTISFDNVNLISERDLIAINARSKVDDGDIIMPMIGTIGKPTIVIKTREFAIKNVALIKFSEAKRVLNIYIQKLLDSESYSRFIKEQNRGGTQKFISLGMIRKLPTPLPPLSLQQEFAEKVEAIEKQKALIQQSIAETQTLFDSRMDHWFS